MEFYIRHEFITEYRAAFNIMTANRHMNLRKFELSKKEWGLATELCEVLEVGFTTFFFFIIDLIYLLYQIFKHGNLFFSCNTPSISTVIPAMDHINEYLATACQNTKLSKAIHAALALGKQTLNCYYNKTDLSDVYRIAMGKSLHSSIYLCPPTQLYSPPPSS